MLQVVLLKSLFLYKLHKWLQMVTWNTTATTKVNGIVKTFENPSDVYFVESQEQDVVYMALKHVKLLGHFWD